MLSVNPLQWEEMGSLFVCCRQSEGRSSTMSCTVIKCVADFYVPLKMNPDFLPQHHEQGSKFSPSNLDQYSIPVTFKEVSTVYTQISEYKSGETMKVMEVEFPHGENPSNISPWQTKETNPVNFSSTAGGAVKVWRQRSRGRSRIRVYIGHELMKEGVELHLSHFKAMSRVFTNLWNK